MIRFFFAIFFAIFFLGTPTSAAWHEAQSDHFVIYADQSPEDVLDFATRLERFHNAMRIQLRTEASKPSPSNRVTVYVVRDAQQVRKLLGGDSKYVGGFYIPRAGGSIAIVPKVESAGAAVANSELILLHEYAHHMMYSNSQIVFPAWLSEGFAEFYATAKFERDGSVGLGLPAIHRAGELAFAANVSAEQLLDSSVYARRKGGGYDEFYGRSWALYHMLRFDENRKGQLAEYGRQLTSGSSEKSAALAAFGDLKQLERDMNAYLRKSRMSYYKISGPELAPGPIIIRKLGVSESAMIPVRIRSKRGVNTEQAAELLPEARAVAAKYPSDAAVLSALAEAEFDAGNSNEAIAAADRALAINPSDVNALLQKAYAMERLADNNDDSDKAWKAVRTQYLRVNKIEADHPIPLIRFYQSYYRQGIEPTKNAKDGLEWALQLSPFDQGLRFTVGQHLMSEKRYDDAIYTLEPLAKSVHGSELSERAAELIVEAEAKAKDVGDSSASEMAEAPK